MTAFLGTIGLPELVAGILVLALNAYALTGGADFGGGVWDLLASGPRRDAQRALIAEQIGPIWEANHVWLVLVVVVLFTAFPPAFATLGIVLHVPLSLMLIGIVLRGSSFVFRSYGARDDAAQRRWSRVFAGASVVTPVLLGIIVGAIASGAVGRAAASLPADGATGPTATFAATFIAPWLAPFPFTIGVLALAMFAQLAATYLAVAARDDALREDFRRRALGAALAVAVVAIVGLAVAHRHAPDVGRSLTAGWALFPIGAAAAALAAGYALAARRWALARIAAGAEVSLILWGWVAAQYPLLIPPSATVRGVAAPRATLTLLLYALAGGGVILLPALAWLFRLFGRRVSASASRR
jgi:cytochrome d ubiquinol oxidase subunit II